MYVGICALGGMLSCGQWEIIAEAYYENHCLLLVFLWLVRIFNFAVVSMTNFTKSWIFSMAS